ncbi:hypothetical protein Q3G72_006082 [Acer saccharum]|nr:hypothetical protein Q3G72_004492 [Acer saccharum]KAK1551860.1 hypothetical protein Q3G72_006082 [Acer saccharum]
MICLTNVILSISLATIQWEKCMPLPHWQDEYYSLQLETNEQGDAEEFYMYINLCAINLNALTSTYNTSLNNEIKYVENQYIGDVPWFGLQDSHDHTFEIVSEPRVLVQQSAWRSRRRSPRHGGRLDRCDLGGGGGCGREAED